MVSAVHQSPLFLPILRHENKNMVTFMNENMFYGVLTLWYINCTIVIFLVHTLSYMITALKQEIIAYVHICMTNIDRHTVSQSYQVIRVTRRGYFIVKF